MKADAFRASGFALGNAHLQTLLGAFLPAPLPVGMAAPRCIDVPVAAGTSVRLFISDPGEAPTQPDGSPSPVKAPPRGTVFILHGIAGSADSRLVVRCATECSRRGYVAVRINNRNCGDGFATSKTLYNAGMSGDLAAVLLSEAARSLPHPQVAIGYSLGGNLLLKYLGESERRAKAQPAKAQPLNPISHGGNDRPDGPGWAGRSSAHFGRGTPLAAAVALSPPIDLDATERSLARARNFIYQASFVRSLVSAAVRRHRIAPDRYPAASIFRTPTLRAFDDRFTAPDGGYENAVDYYRSVSSAPLLDRIGIPTRIVSALDDPIIPASIFDGIVSRNPHIDWVITENGGHCGWVKRSAGRFESQAPSFALDFLEAAISSPGPAHLPKESD